MDNLLDLRTNDPVLKYAIHKVKAWEDQPSVQTQFVKDVEGVDLADQVDLMGMNDIDRQLKLHAENFSNLSGKFSIEKIAQGYETSLLKTV